MRCPRCQQENPQEARFNLRATFDVVAESSARLCVSLDAHVFVREGDLLRLVGHSTARSPPNPRSR
jgi:hypothetical protein